MYMYYENFKIMHLHLHYRLRLAMYMYSIHIEDEGWNNLKLAKLVLKLEFMAGKICTWKKEKKKKRKENKTCKVE